MRIIWELLEMQILRPQTRPTKSGTLFSVGPAVCVLTRPPGVDENFRTIVKDIIHVCQEMVEEQMHRGSKARRPSFTQSG
jgi:hypothetical protein